MGAAAVESPPPPWALHDATEWQGFSGTAEALVRPGSAAEVAALVGWCYERDVPIAIRGGGTGLAGGAVPQGGLVLSLDRLDRVRRVVPELRILEAEAGVTTATVARRAREGGLAFPIDPGAAEASQIGGNVATNAGGPHSARHGATRRWVAALEAVLAPGEVVSTGSGLPRDVAGYDLAGLLCGSEGTLGIVTSVTLRLMPAPAPARALVVFHADAAAGARAAGDALAAGAQPAVLDFLDAGALAASLGSFPGEVPSGAGFALLCEDVDEEDREALAAGALRTVEPDAAALWRWRAGVSHAVAAQRGGKLSDDVAVPPERLGEAVDGVVAAGAAHGLDACSWGHAADGILHATFMADPREPGELERAKAAAEDVFDLALALGGTITGEHGVGRLKRHRLAAAIGPEATAAMRRMKAALDPKGLLNPGVKVP